MNESKRLYKDLIELLSRSLDFATVIIVNGDGGQITTVALGEDENDDCSQSAPFADGVGILIHFGVIDTHWARGLTVFNGVGKPEVEVVQP